MSSATTGDLNQAHGWLRTACVTGTNGKTSIMLASIVAASGETSASMTILGCEIAGRVLERSRAQALGLASHWTADVAVFTNLRHGHLDDHASSCDVVVIAGKGHETNQEHKDCKLVLSDSETASQAMARRR